MIWELWCKSLFRLRPRAAFGGHDICQQKFPFPFPRGQSRSLPCRVLTIVPLLILLVISSPGWRLIRLHVSVLVPFLLPANRLGLSPVRLPLPQGLAKDEAHCLTISDASSAARPRPFLSHVDSSICVTSRTVLMRGCDRFLTRVRATRYTDTTLKTSLMATG